MAVQGEPGEWPPLNLIPTTTVGVQRMPSLPWPAFWNLIFLPLSTAWSTIPGFHISLPSMEPTDQNLKLQAPKASSHPQHPKYLMTISERRPLLGSVLVVPPSQSLCPQTLHLVVFLGLVEWLVAGCSSNQTWWHLFFCPSLLSLWQSLLLDLALDLEWFLVWLSLTISSSRVVHCSQHLLVGLMNHSQTSLHGVIVSSPVEDATPGEIGAPRMRPHCGCRGLFLFASWAVWERGHHLFEDHQLSRRGSG